jgi:hypothetical protein
VERLGGRIGGLLAAVPSTIVPASLGFWWSTKDVTDYKKALYIVPVGMLVNACFLYCWRVFPKHFKPQGLKTLLVKVALSALIVWTLVALAMITLARSEGIDTQTLGFLCLTLQILAGITSCWNHLPAPKGGRKVTLPTLFMRGLLAGSAISLSVAIAALGNPLVAGVASVFPAIFLTTMISVWLSQGQAVPMGAVGPIMLGSSSVSVFALTAAWSVPELGPMLGITISWLFSVLVVSIPAWFFLNKRAGA